MRVSRARVLIDRVEADEFDPEVSQPVEQPVELGLVGKRPGDGGLARPRLDLELVERGRESIAESTADDDAVAALVCAVLLHPFSLAPDWMSGHHPAHGVTQGESV